MSIPECLPHPLTQLWLSSSVSIVIIVPDSQMPVIQYIPTVSVTDHHHLAYYYGYGYNYKIKK